MRASGSRACADSELGFCVVLGCGCSVYTSTRVSPLSCPLCHTQVPCPASSLLSGSTASQRREKDANEINSRPLKIASPPPFISPPSCR